jgi:hypothetical protein
VKFFANTGALPKDTNGVYFVLTSADVNETSGFRTQYCGWHARGTIAGSDIKYAFIGNNVVLRRTARGTTQLHE